MKFRKLCVGLAILLIFNNVFCATKKSKYVEMPLEEFNKTDRNELVKKKNIAITDYFRPSEIHKISSIEYNFVRIDWTKAEKNYENCAYRTKTHNWEKEIYTYTIKGTMHYEPRGNYFTFYVNEIENLRTMEEVEAKKQVMQKRLDKIKDLIPAKMEEIKKSADDCGKTIAKKYTYHGFEEHEKNAKLFINGALENGHAYYLTAFQIDEHFKSAGTISANRNKAVIVNYEPESIKTKIVELESTDVIVVGNKIVPTVIGTIGELISIKLFIYENLNYYQLDKDRMPATFETIEKFEKEFGIEVENE